MEELLNIRSVVYFGGLILAIGAGWGTAKSMINGAHARIKKAEEWISGHEKDAVEHRVSYERRFGMIEGALREQTVNTREIMRRLESIDGNIQEIKRDQKGD